MVNPRSEPKQLTPEKIDDLNRKDPRTVRKLFNYLDEVNSLEIKEGVIVPEGLPEYTIGAAALKLVRQMEDNTKKDMVREKIINLVKEKAKNGDGKTVSITVPETTKIVNDVKRHVEGEVVLPPNVTIMHGDFMDADIPDGSIDAIITDPPYGEEYLDCYRNLGEFAYRVLKPGGFLVAYVGKQHTNLIFRFFDDSGLVYFWTLALTFKLNAVAYDHPMGMRSGGFVSCYRPVLVYYKPPRKEKMNGIIQDAIESEREKEFHEWQQAVGPMGYVIEALTDPGATILDPCTGTGTFGIDAVQCGRNFIGIDIDEKMVELAKHRVAEAVRAMDKKKSDTAKGSASAS